MLSVYYKHKKKKLFCTFVDFKKAFDSVWRAGLWKKLLGYIGNDDSKFLKVVQSMYNNIKSCISINGNNSDFFYSNIGLRQGENLSPVLFSIFLNDLEHYLLANSDINLSMDDENLNVFLKIVVILYADDTVVFAHTEHDMISIMNCFQNYCNLWNLNINFDKTKVLIFGDRSARNRQRFIHMCGHDVEVVDSFKFLGVTFSKNRLFTTAKNNNVQQARKALFSLYRKIRNLELPIDCQLKLFDSTIVPILTYGCEVWGFGDLSAIERIHTDFLKYILNVKKSTPHVMLYGELGRFPLSIVIKKRIIGFWHNIINNENKLSSIVYRYIFNHANIQNFEYKWLSNVKSIFEEIGLNNIWLNQTTTLSKNVLVNKIESILKDQYLQSWHNDVFNSHKCINYRLFKDTHGFETYFDSLSGFNCINDFINFRLCNNHLPIEKGRWLGIPRNERVCKLCDKNQLGDEFHYLFSCPHFQEARNKYIGHVNCINPNMYTLKYVMCESDLYKLKGICYFVSLINKTLKTPPGLNN